VWPDAENETWGSVVESFYPRVPDAAKADARLYELLALTDALRIGRPWERSCPVSYFVISCCRPMANQANLAAPQAVA
jgi:hypothetical protein